MRKLKRAGGKGRRGKESRGKKKRMEGGGKKERGKEAGLEETRYL